LQHLPGLLPQPLPNRLRRSPTLDHGFKVPQQMRPTDLPPPRGIPRIGAPAVRDQRATKPLAQQLLPDLGPTRQPDYTDRDPRGDRHPQPRSGMPFAPSRLVKMRDRLRTDVFLSFHYWDGQCLVVYLMPVDNSIGLKTR